MPSALTSCFDDVTLARLGKADCGDVHAVGDTVWRPLATEPAAAETISAGDGFFSFCCASGDDIADDARDIVRAGSHRRNPWRRRGRHRVNCQVCLQPVRGVWRTICRAGACEARAAIRFIRRDWRR